MSVKPGIRPHIQGLRAIAVLTVIAAHAGIGALKGGYVGVDVFFVISGFLISTLLYREVDRSGRLSLTGFYARRARRILPAATVVTLATLVGSLIWLSLEEAVQVVYDAGWAAAFMANLHFAAIETDYFAQDQGPSPLQHYWSLSVEEQFYLAWPLILIGCLVLAHRRRKASAPAGLPRSTVFLVLVALIVASLVYSVWFTTTEPAGAYFSTLARIWELGLGAVTALVGPTLAGRFPRWVRGALAAGGLAAIALATVTFSESTLFPGYAAALPVVGTAAVLLAGAVTDEPAPLRVLGWTPLRLVGDWSYSLYLWHWPLLVIPERHLGRPLTTGEVLAALTVTFVLSWATYRWVETPFRDGRRLTVPRALTLYPVSLALIASSCTGGYYWIQWQAGAMGNHPAITLTNFGDPQEGQVRLDPDPALAIVQASVIAARHGMAVPSDLTPVLLDLRDDNPDISDCDYSQGARDLCPRGDLEGDRTLVVLGDSHGRMWIPALEGYGTQHGWKIYFLVKPHCTAAHVLTDENGEGRPWQDCPDFHAWAEQQMAELHPDLVVVSTGVFSHNFFVGDRRVTDDDEIAGLARQGFVDLFTAVRPLTDRLVLLRDIPMARQDPAVCLTTGHPDLGACMFTPDPRSALMADMSVQAARQTGTPVVDPTKWLCWDGSCPVIIGSTISYRDTNHMSAAYSARLADPLARALQLDRP